MASAYDKLKRILTLERDQGYRDRAVIGGLARFLSYWEKEAREEAAQVQHVLPLGDILQALAGYGERPIEARRMALGRLLEALTQDVGTSLAPAPTPAGAPSPEQTSPPVAPALTKAAHAGETLTLDSPVTRLRGISTATEERLAKLGIVSVRDLLYHFPRRYDDFSSLKTINRLQLGDEVTVVGGVRDAKLQPTRSGQQLLRVVVSDGTGAIECTWFNQAYLEKRFKPGTEIAISGQVQEYLGRLIFSAPEWEPLQRELLHTGRLVPVYPLTEGISARWLRSLQKKTLDYWVPRLADPVPPAVLQSAGLEPLGMALAQMHFPDSQPALEAARQRLCFDEFLLLQLGILRQKRIRHAQPGPAIPTPQAELDAFIGRLPFKLTGAQGRALGEILGDLARPAAMSRLLQGDVGSGKTVVAAAAILAATRAGLQAAVMAPTSILAEQHYLTMTRLFEGCENVKCALLVGSLVNAEKQRLHQEIAEGQVQVVIGTHALIQSSVSFANLGLVVVDEQHRFGVGQRAALREKGGAAQPHLLAMSATPIPRTLALTIYGDLDISVLDELPPNRQRILTAVRDHTGRERVYSFINTQVKQGRQAFIICPLVEESDAIDAKAATAEYERLQKRVFPHLKLGLLHGRMGAEEKERVMADFKAGAYQILVSTAVVEVGIDVPNATIMLVEGAEHFGLAQLHQFRGRVGRGEHQSYCILLSDDPSELSIERLHIMEDTYDGFVLAEKDLELRGPGDFFGERQHGLPMLKVAQLSDTAILEKARNEAQRLFGEDPELVAPEHQMLAQSVVQFWTRQDLS